MLRLQNIERDFEILDDLFEERRAKVYKERLSAFDLADDEFLSIYKFDKVTTRFIISLLNMEEPKNKRGLPIPISLQVLTALRLFGRNAQQTDVADLHGMSQQTVGRVIKRISKEIALLLPHFIKFPRNAELDNVKKRFHQIAGFPNVIGAIDCIHVHRKYPTKIFGQEITGAERKGFYSLNVQIVCDADNRILDIVTRSTDSKHDGRIWAECQLKNSLEQSKMEHNGVLLGDANYPLSPILLTPITNPSNNKEEKYNKSHVAIRGKIKCLSGALESKFRNLFERTRVEIDTAKNIVLAVAVLHNIAMERNFSFLEICSAVEPVSQRFDFGAASSNSNQTSNGGESAYRTAFIEANF